MKQYCLKYCSECSQPFMGHPEEELNCGSLCSSCFKPEAEINEIEMKHMIEDEQVRALEDYFWESNFPDWREQ